LTKRDSDVLSSGTHKPRLYSSVIDVPLDLMLSRSGVFFFEFSNAERIDASGEP